LKDYSMAWVKFCSPLYLNLAANIGIIHYNIKYIS
jgi:hypothetical protein